MPRLDLIFLHSASADGYNVRRLATMDNTAGQIETGLQQVGTHHSRNCLGETVMQTFRGMPHVAHEKSLCEHAPGASPHAG